MRRVNHTVIKLYGSWTGFVVWLAAVSATMYATSVLFPMDNQEQSAAPIEVTRREQPAEKVAAVAAPPEKVAAVAAPAEKVAVVAAPPAKVAAVAAPPAAPKVETKKETPKKIDSKPEAKCGMKAACPAGQFAYLVKIADGSAGHPTICFNGKFAVSPDLSNGVRGINIAIFNVETGDLKKEAGFDTYESDYLEVGNFLEEADEKTVILAATMDEASKRIDPETKSSLNQYGSSAIDNIGFRDGLVMLGQKGLAKGKAIEKLSPKGDGAFAPGVEITGCLSLPMGKEAAAKAAPAKAAPAKSA